MKPGHKPLSLCPTCGKLLFGETICPADSSVLVQVNQAKLTNSLVLDRYQLFDVFACGGWSEIYKGHDTVLDRNIAFKVLFSHLSWDPESMGRFHQEARAAARIAHPNVVSVFDFGILPEGEPFIAMEYVDGKSLREILEEEGQLPWSTACNIFLQACSALQASHSLSIIHRDIKPGNILIPSDPAQPVKLVDFGLAKLAASEANLTASGETIGTPSYMSPEQCLGSEIDCRSDIYSLGCVMYETLMGKAPFTGISMFALMLQHVNEMPPPFSQHHDGAAVPPDLTRIVMKCLMKSPDHRYQNVATLAADLTMVASGKRLKFVPPAVITRPRVITALFCVIVMFTVLTLQFTSAPTSAELNPFLKAFEPNKNVFHAERPPGLGFLADDQVLVWPRFGVASRKVHKEQARNGSVSYFYSGKLGGWNPTSQVAFVAQTTLDAQKELSQSSITYMGDVSFKALTKKGEAKTLEHVKEIRTEHLEDGWLNTLITCFNGRQFAVLTAENGRVQEFVTMANADMSARFNRREGDLLWGFVDNTATMRIPAKYQMVRSFSEGLAAVSRNGELWGFINNRGEEVIPMQFRKCGDFSEGLAAVWDAEDRCGFIDKSGQWKIMAQFDQAGQFKEGMAPVYIERTRDWRYINRKGRLVLPALDSDDRFSEGLAVCRGGDFNLGYMNNKGQIVIRPQFNGADAFYQGRAWVSQDNHCFYINKKGERVTPLFSMGVCNAFSEGLASFAVDKQYGFIDSDGKIKIAPRFSNWSSFSQGLAAVSLGSKTCYIDTTGKVVIAPAYFVAGSFANDRAWIRKYGRYGLIDHSGATVVAPRFLEAMDFSGGLAAVALPASAKDDLSWHVGQ